MHAAGLRDPNRPGLKILLDANDTPPRDNEETALPHQDEAQPPLPPPQPALDPRRRIRELLAIPDRDRTDAEWDELNELEIQTAPGNRVNGQPFAVYAAPGKPGGMSGGGKNRFKNKQRKSGGGPRPPQQQAKPNHKPPRPAS